LSSREHIYTVPSFGCYAYFNGGIINGAASVFCNSRGPMGGDILANHRRLNAVFYFLAGAIVIPNLAGFFTPTPER
jgi:hypothetical protein